MLNEATARDRHDVHLQNAHSFDHGQHAVQVDEQREPQIRPTLCLI